MAQVSIKNLESYGNDGWMWTEEVHTDYEDSEVSYRTNSQGDGLWVVDSDNPSNDKQVSGTCQFSLPADRKAAYSKIRHETLKAQVL